MPSNPNTIKGNKIRTAAVGLIATIGAVAGTVGAANIVGGNLDNDPVAVQQRQKTQALFDKGAEIAAATAISAVDDGLKEKAKSDADELIKPTPKPDEPNTIGAEKSDPVLIAPETTIRNETPQQKVEEPNVGIGQADIQMPGEEPKVING